MRALVLSVCAVMLSVAGVGCAVDDYAATFIRYEKLQDDTQVAVVEYGGDGADFQVQAWCDLDDLKPGEEVLIQTVGRDWDQPQWTPEVQVTGRPE